jgi:hypothetical protein
MRCGLRGNPTGLVGSPATDSTTATDVKLTIKFSILGLGDTRSVSTDIVGYQWVLPGS